MRVEKSMATVFLALALTIAPTFGCDSAGGGNGADAGQTNDISAADSTATPPDVSADATASADTSPANNAPAECADWSGKTTDDCVALPQTSPMDTCAINVCILCVSYDALVASCAPAPPEVCATELRCAEEQIACLGAIDCTADAAAVSAAIDACHDANQACQSDG